MRHPSAQHRAAHHAIIEQWFPLCSKFRCLILPIDRHMWGIGNSSTPILHLYIIMMVDLCGPTSQGASGELFCSAGFSYIYCLNAVPAHRSNLPETRFLVQGAKKKKIILKEAAFKISFHVFSTSGSDMENEHSIGRQNNSALHLCLAYTCAFMHRQGKLTHLIPPPPCLGTQ